MKLLLKSHIKAHSRTDPKTGKVAQVREYDDSRVKKEKESPTYRYRISRLHRNSVAVRPLVGTKFDAVKREEMEATLKRGGLSVMPLGGHFRVIGDATDTDVGAKVETLLPLYESVRAKNSRLAAQEWAAKDKAKRAARDEYLKQSKSVPWIKDMFGEGVVNPSNTEALARFLEGEDSKFMGVPSRAWKDGVEKLDAMTPDFRVDFGKIKEAYNARKDAAPPAPSIVEHLQHLLTIASKPGTSVGEQSKLVREGVEAVRKKLDDSARKDTVPAKALQAFRERIDALEARFDRSGGYGDKSERSKPHWTVDSPSLVSSHSGQHDLTLYARNEAGQPLGALEYSLFDGKVHINHITVRPEFRRRGIGRSLIARLKKEESDHAIMWGMLTDDGTQFKASVDPGKSTGLKRANSIKDSKRESTDYANSTQLSLFKRIKDRLYLIFSKAHVKTFQRTNAKTGQTSTVKEHDDSRSAARPYQKKAREKKVTWENDFGSDKHRRPQARAKPLPPYEPSASSLARHEMIAQAHKLRGDKREFGEKDPEPSKYSQSDEFRQADRDHVKGQEVHANLARQLKKLKNLAVSPDINASNVSSKRDQFYDQLGHIKDLLRDAPKAAGVPADHFEEYHEIATKIHNTFAAKVDDLTPLPAFKPIPHPQHEDEAQAWLAAVMEQPDIKRATRENKGTPTDKIYKQADGTYTPERAADHDAIISGMFNHKAEAKVGAKPHAFILMGAPGAGKTSTLAPMQKEMGLEFTTISADDVKRKLKGYTGTNAVVVHQESNDVASKLLSQGIDAKHNLLMDNTGTDKKRMTKMVDDFHNAGYDITIAYVHVPVYEAAARAVDRFRETGRFMPPDFIMNNIADGPEKTYNVLKRDPRVGHWRRYNNEGTVDDEPQQEEYARRTPDESRRPFAKSSTFARRSIRGHGQFNYGRLQRSVQGPLGKAHRLHASLTKSIVYLTDDLESPDIDSPSRGILLAERLRLLDQHQQLTTRLCEITGTVRAS